MNKDSNKKLLYQPLPSIEPRVSRYERLSSRKICYECEPQFMRNAKNKSKYLHLFYIAILIIGIAVITVYNRNNNQNILQVADNTKTIKISLFRDINATLVQSQNRYGLSILLRNNESKLWKVDYIIINDSNENIIGNIPVNQTLKKKEFYSLFVPLPKEYSTIDNIFISTIP